MKFCNRCQEQLGEYLDGTLSPSDRAAVDAHLKGCFECQSELADLKLARRALQFLTPAAAPVELRARVRAAIQNGPGRQPAFDFWRAVNFLQGPKLAWGGAATLSALALYVLAHPFLDRPIELATSATGEPVPAETAQFQRAKSPAKEKIGQPPLKSFRARTNSSQNSAAPNLAAPGKVVTPLNQNAEIPQVDPSSQSINAARAVVPKIEPRTRPKISALPAPKISSPGPVTQKISKVNTELPRITNSPSPTPFFRTQVTEPKKNLAAAPKVNLADDQIAATKHFSLDIKATGKQSLNQGSSRFQRGTADAGSVSSKSAAKMKTMQAPTFDSPASAPAASAPAASAPAASALSSPGTPGSVSNAPITPPTKPSEAESQRNSVSPSAKVSGGFGAARGGNSGGGNSGGGGFGGGAMGGAGNGSIGGRSDVVPPAMMRSRVANGRAAAVEMPNQFEIVIKASREMKDAQIRVELPLPLHFAGGEAAPSQVVWSGNFAAGQTVRVSLSLLGAKGGEKISVYLEQKSGLPQSKPFETQTLPLPQPQK